MGFESKLILYKIPGESPEEDNSIVEEEVIEEKPKKSRAETMQELVDSSKSEDYVTGGVGIPSRVEIKPVVSQISPTPVTYNYKDRYDKPLIYMVYFTVEVDSCIKEAGMKTIQSNKLDAIEAVLLQYPKADNIMVYRVDEITNEYKLV